MLWRCWKLLSLVMLTYFNILHSSMLAGAPTGACVTCVAVEWCRTWHILTLSTFWMYTSIKHCAKQ